MVPTFCKDLSLGPSATWRTHGTRSYVGTIYRVSKVDRVCKVGTFSEALPFCRNIEGADARLCTSLEMENSCAKGTGCKFDQHQIWTACI